MKISKPYYVGIDYSMTSPAICVCYNPVFNFQDCKFFYLTKEKSKLQNTHPFHSTDLLFDDFKSNDERFIRIALWAESCIVPPAKPVVGLEGYSFASKGQVFNIGENTFALKSRLYQSNLNYHVYAPGTVKKFATEKGNADKSQMLKAFKDDTGFCLEAQFDVIQRKNKSPAADIADAYFICKLAASENPFTA